MALRLAVSTVVAAACVLSACGDGDEPRTISEQRRADARQIRAVMTEALTTSDPADCTRLFTLRAVEQLTLRRGQSAIAKCRFDSKGASAASLAFSGISVRDAQAAAQVEPSGGGLPLRKATFALRKAGGRWRIDRLTAGTLNRAAFFAQARTEWSRPHNSPSPQHTKCMMAELRRANDEELAGIYVRADVRQLVVPLVMCMLRLALPRFPATAPFVDCMTRRTRRELTSGAIGSALDDDADLGLLDADAYWGFIEGIARGCARETLPRTPPGRVS